MKIPNLKAIKDWCLSKFQPKGDYASTDSLNSYSLVSDAGHSLSLDIDENYIMTIALKNVGGEILSSKSIDFPIESMVVNASYLDGIVTLSLQNGTTLPVDISSIVSGLVNDTFTIAGIDMNDNITAQELLVSLGIDMFVGTKAEYKAAYTQGRIKEGTIVNITDDEETSDLQDQIDNIKSITLGGLTFYEDETGKYVVGADAVPKKLGSGNLQCYIADSVSYSASGDYQLTYDLSAVCENYQNLTLDNMLGGLSGAGSKTNSALIRSGSVSFTGLDNYDQSTGIITYTITIYSQSGNCTVSATPCFYICS